jgi:GAF domain-containing protein
MKSAETLANLQKVLTLLDPASDLEEMLTNVARQLVEMFGVDHSGVLLYGADDVEGVVIAEYPPQAAVGLKLPLTNYPLVTQLKAQRKPLAVLDAQHDPIMGAVRPTMQKLGIHSILIIPLIVKDKLIGGLGLDAMQGPRAFTPDEIDLAYTIGKQLAVAIDYTASLQVVEKSRHQTQILREVSQTLGETLNLEEVLPLILEQLEKVLPVDGSSIYLLVEDNVQLKARRGGYTPFQNQQIIPLKRLWGAAEIVRTRKPLLVGDTAHHPHWDHYQGSPLKSWLGNP